MIFDRTQNDVDTAKFLIKEKVEFDPSTMKPINIEELTQDELEILKKGTFNYTDLNRIESKQEELKYLLNSLGYWNVNIENKQWTETEVFKIVDFERIINNTNVLHSSFYVYSNTPKIPSASYYWENINNLEKILHDLNMMIEYIQLHFKECGTFESGE